MILPAQGCIMRQNIATLVASEETIQNLSAVQQFVIAYQETGEIPHEQEFSKAKLSLIFAMNKRSDALPRPSHQLRYTVNTIPQKRRSTRLQTR